MENVPNQYGCTITLTNTPLSCVHLSGRNGGKKSEIKKREYVALHVPEFHFFGPIEVQDFAAYFHLFFLLSFDFLLNRMSAHLQYIYFGAWSVAR